MTEVLEQTAAMRFSPAVISCLRHLSLWVLLLSCSGFAAFAGEAKKPNVIFVLVDDLGYGDLGCTGNKEAATPNIDRLASEGTRFTQFHVNSPICSPSRVAFTTGQYPQRWKMHSFLSDRAANQRRGMPNFLDPKAPAIARAFKHAGYATAHFGKWHLGGGRDVGDAPLPQEYGWDESLGSFEGLGDRILPPGDLSDQSAKLGRGKITRVQKHEQTGIYVDRAIDFIKRKKGQPFYLHLWLNDVHDPLHPAPGAAENFAGKGRNDEDRKLFAVLTEMDRQLGRLFAAVDELGLGEDTLILLTGDNGPTAWAHYYKNGIQPPGSTAGDRGRKWSLYEGGIRQPLIARWKAKVPAGRVDSSSLIAAVDFFPTLATLAGVQPPDVAFDGTDVSDAFLGKQFTRTRPVIWEYRHDIKPGDPRDVSPELALRDGNWKFLMNRDGSRPELYNLSEDSAESNNLVQEHPEKVRTFSSQLKDWVAAVSPAPRKPNVLFISTDDLNLDIGAYGHPIVKTPHLDRLASRGVKFDVAYCQYPLCNPSRISMLTGVRPDTAQVHDLATNFRSTMPDSVTLPQLFRQNGYFTARVGKIFHYGVPREIGTSGKDDPISWDTVVNPIGRDKTEEDKLHVLTRGTGTTLGFAMAWLDMEGTDEEQTDGQGVTETIRLLEQAAQSEKPFFIGMGFYRPHTPFVATKKWFDLYPKDKVRLPPAGTNGLENVPDISLYIRPPHYGLGESELRDCIRGYWSSVSFLDDQVGRLLATLERLQLADNTIVVFFSDNGFLLGQHGQWQKQLLFDESARVPLIIYAPGAKGNGKNCARPVELLDVYPTLRELCALPIPPQKLEGRSLVPLLNDPSAPFKPAVFSQVTRSKGKGKTIMGYSARTEQWRYTEWGVHGKDGLELYDHKTDPYELINLAKKPEYAKVVAEMQKHLATIRTQN